MNGEGGPEGGAREGPRDGRSTDPFPRPNPCPESPGRSGFAPPALTAGLVSYIGSRHLENANHFRREGLGSRPLPTGSGAPLVACHHFGLKGRVQHFMDGGGGGG